MRCRPASALGDGTTPDASIPDPCLLVTAAEIKAATGVAYPKGTPATGEIN